MIADSHRVVFETERLRAREMSLADLDFVASLLADPEVMRFYPKCFSRDEAQGWIERQVRRYEAHGHGLWLVVDRRSDQPVGQVGLLRQSVDGREEAEIGYLLHRPFWKRGYATEAGRATRDHAFQVLGLPYVISLIQPRNAPSRAVAARLGMLPERTTTFAGLEHLVFTVARPAAGGPLSTKVSEERCDPKESFSGPPWAPGYWP